MGLSCYNEGRAKNWSASDEAYLLKWWPHFSTKHTASLMGLTFWQVRYKVQKLDLRLLPKCERLCLQCKVNRQHKRREGFLCVNCYKARRGYTRHKQKSLRLWIGDVVRTARHRAKILSDLTTDYMINQWKQQEGRCFYSGIEMEQPIYGNNRRWCSPSIDRIDSSKDYVQGNVVWAIWVCNCAKNNLRTQKYIDICNSVVKTQYAKISFGFHGDGI